MATVWMTVTLCMQKAALLRYAIYPNIQKYQIYTLLYVMIRSISHISNSRLSHCKANIVHNCGPYSSDMQLCLGLFLCFASVHFHAILTLSSSSSCWPWLFPGCSSIVRICNSCLYAFQLKVHEMHLWAISENWFIIDWSTFSSLMKVKIHLHNSWPI